MRPRINWYEVVCRECGETLSKCRACRLPYYPRCIVDWCPSCLEIIPGGREDNQQKEVVAC